MSALIAWLTGRTTKTPATPYALSSRPDLLGWCEGVTLAAALSEVRVWR